MAHMLKSDALGYYNVEYDEETGEIIHDPRAIKPEPIKEVKAAPPKTIAELKAMKKVK